jgi:hypothetical protein
LQNPDHKAVELVCLRWYGASRSRNSGGPIPRDHISPRRRRASSRVSHRFLLFSAPQENGAHSQSSLVFVHGLNPFSNPNHAFDTWKHENGKFWPYDFLPQDIPEARIWVYGYNSNIAKDVSEARIKDHANVLLDRLQRKRKEGRVYRRIL